MRSLTPLLLIAVSLGLFYVHVDPRYGDVKALLERKAQYALALEKAESLKQKKEELVTKYNNLSKEDLLKLERVLPNQLNTVKLVADVDSIAGKYGIAIRGIKVTEEAVDRSQIVNQTESVKGYKTTIVSFKFAATYQNLVQYLRDLEKSLQLIDITSISFQTGEGKPGAINDYEVSFQTYSLK